MSSGLDNYTEEEKQKLFLIMDVLTGEADEDDIKEFQQMELDEVMASVDDCRATQERYCEYQDFKGVEGWDDLFRTVEKNGMKVVDISDYFEEKEC